MTTRAGLVTIIRNQGIDVTNWSDIEIHQWISDAIAEYEQHWPLQVETADNDCTADPQEYTLPTDFRAMLRVEYPQDEDPRIYVERMDRTDPRFGDGYYDIHHTELVLGASPTAGQLYTILYQAHHDYPDADEDVLTVPDEDLELLVLYVKWKAIVRLELDEAVDPDHASIILSVLGTNAGRAHFQYMRMLRSRLSQIPHAAAVSWGNVD